MLQSLDHHVHSDVFLVRTQPRTRQAAWLLLSLMGLQKWLRNAMCRRRVRSLQAKAESACCHWARPDVLGLWPLYAWFMLPGEWHVQGHSATERLFLGEDWSLPLYSMHMVTTFSAVKFKTCAGQSIFTASRCDRPYESYGQNDEIEISETFNGL